MSRTSRGILVAIALSGAVVGPTTAHAVGPERPAPAAEIPAEDPAQELATLSPLAAWTSVGLVYSGLWGWTTAAWYVGKAENDFELRDEGFFERDSYAGGADKLGHLWANYALTRGVIGILEQGGVPRSRAMLYSVAMATGFFTFSEVKDGYHGFGFSWQDLVMNTLGQGLGVAAIVWPELDEALDLRIQYFPSSEFVRRVREDGPFNSPEDYTGQTYYLAWHLASLDAVKASSRWGWLGYVDLNLGFAARGYLPVPMDGEAPSQQLFLGFGLNLQHVVDRTMVPTGVSKRWQRPRDARRATGTGTQVLGFVAEVYVPPLVTVELGGLERSGSRPSESAP